MLNKDEEKTRKLVGMLIEVLHGEYSDTRDLAVVQLAILGQKAVPYICSYLKEEGELEKDLIAYHKMYVRDKTRPKLTSFADDFKKKWGCHPLESGETDKKDYEQRRQAVDGALEALSIIGDSKAIPVLQTLPIYDYVIRTELETLSSGKVPLFSKAKETIKKIQSNPD